MEQAQTQWESAYRRGETPWDKGAAHPALLDFVAERGAPAGEILVPGCGYGFDVRALSTPENHVLGVDIAPFAIGRAESFPKVAGEKYLLGDIFSLTRALATRFDIVFEHTCFCAIEPGTRSNYVGVVRQILKPGGKLIAIFFMNPDHDEPGPPYGTSRQELAALFGTEFALQEEWIPARTFPGREQRELLRVLSFSPERHAT
jgi:methyl halide transferase